MMKNWKLSVCSVLIFAIGCDSQTEEQPEPLAARDYTSADAPAPLNIELDELTPAPEGTMLVEIGTLRPNDRISDISLNWLFPNGARKEVPFDGSEINFSPSISPDRKTLIFDEKATERFGHSVIRISKEGFTPLTHFFNGQSLVIEDIFFRDSITSQRSYDWSSDGRFLGIWSTDGEEANWTFHLYDIVQGPGEDFEIYKSSSREEPGVVRAMNGLIFAHSTAVDAGKALQLTNAGFNGPVEVETPIYEARFGANGSSWTQESSVLAGSSISVAEKFDAEKVEISNLGTIVDPYPVGDGSQAYLQQRNLLYLVSASGEEQLIAEELDPEVGFIPMLEGVLAQRADGSWAYFDQIGREQSQLGDLSEEFQSFSIQLESGHRYTENLEEEEQEFSTYLGVDDTSFAKLKVDGNRLCSSPQSGIPFGKVVHTVTDDSFRKTEMILIDLSTPEPIEVARLEAEDGFSFSCPAFSLDSKRAIITQNAQGEASISQIITWNSSSDVQIGEKTVNEGISYLKPVVLF